MKLRRALLIVFLLCPHLLHAAPSPRLGFFPPEWKFDMILQGAKIEKTVAVTNNETLAAAVTFVPTCSCLTVTPATRTISPGGTGTFDLTFDSADDVGITTRGFIVRTDIPGTKPAYYLLRGVVRKENRTAGQVPSAAAPGEALPATGWPVAVTYYYTPGCRKCEQFLSVEIPRLAARLARDRGLTLVVKRKDILDPASYQELLDFAGARGESLRATPALAVEETLLQGDGIIRDRLPGILEGMTEGPVQAAPATAGATAAASSRSTAGQIAVLPVVAAGLLDGINPCAFTTLIFLIASLALAGRGRAEVLVVGAAFTASVFLSYFLVGLGFFAALRAASAVAIVSLVLRWVLFAVLAVLAGLSVRDYLLIRRGKPTQILLQLPMALKRRIHSSIRVRVRAATLAGSSIVLGFLVSLFEFACTGQVYLPTLAWLARAGERFDALGLLALYNLAFILPLLVVFAASYAGVSSGRITAAYQAHMGKVKLLLALLFAALAVVTLVG